MATVVRFYAVVIILGSSIKPQVLKMETPCKAAEVIDGRDSSQLRDKVYFAPGILLEDKR
jgi:hypothetical protein